MQAGPQPVAPGRALVRAARVVQEGRCGQAGGPGGRSVMGRDGGAASAAAVRATLGVGEPWDRRSPAVASTRSEERRVGKECRCRWAAEPGRQDSETERVD